MQEEFPSRGSRAMGDARSAAAELTVQARPRFRGEAGLLLAFAIVVGVFLPLRLWRASIENSLWIDETESFMLASHAVPVILDYCTIDTNPPGYFLALKGWLKLGKVFLRAPGVFFARTLGTLAWCLLAVGTAWLGRSLFGQAASALVVSVAGSAYAAVFANDARGYCLASVALFLCFLLVIDLYVHGDRPLAWSVWRWLCFAATALVALWTHLLALPIVALLVLVWAALALRRRTLGFAGFGALAIALTAVGFLPWALRIASEVGGLEKSAVTWMTPATVPNLLAVFYFWYPYGRFGGTDQPGWPFWNALGAASLLLPFTLAILAVSRRRAAANPAHLLVGGVGLGLAIAYTCLLWFLQRQSLVTVFYAPRYPALAAAMWAAGIVALASWTVARMGWRRWAIWLLLAPWLAAGVTGQVRALLAERQGNLREMRAAFAPLLPQEGHDLYAMPSELIPYFRGTFADYRMRRIEDLPCSLPREPTATVIDLNFWHLLDRPRDLVARRVLGSKELARGVASRIFPDWRPDYRVYKLRDVEPGAASALCRRGGFVPTPPPIPVTAAAVALPEHQEYHRGWSFPEVSVALTIRRWATREESEILFDRAVPPGRYRLHLRGYNPPYPMAPARIQVAVAGETGTWQREFGEGEFAADFALTLGARHDPLLVRMERATWSPARATGAADSRTLTVLLDFAWIESDGYGAK
jgi:hypothetical protein